MERKYLELLQAHAEFENQHSGASLDDFYRHMAALKSNQTRQPKTPPDLAARLAKSMGRITSIYNMHLRAAFRLLDIKVPEGFPFLASLYHYGEMRKTDLISFVLVELSTGSEILNRLKKHGLIVERQDQDDKRARIVAISDKGKKLVVPCLKKASEIRADLFKHVSAEKLKTIVEVLEPLERTIASLKTEGKTA